MVVCQCEHIYAVLRAWMCTLQNVGQRKRWKLGPISRQNGSGKTTSRHTHLRFALGPTRMQNTLYLYKNKESQRV